jgi:acetylglutamate kinase
MKKKSQIPDFFINAFYESKFRDNFFVIKAGGKVIEDPSALDNLLSNIRELNLQGIKVLLIYGGGGAMDAESEKRGVKVEKIEGLRINNADNMAVMKHIVGGDLSLSVNAAMAKANLNGLSLNAVPADWMDVKLTPKTKGDDFTGGIGRIHTRPINRLFKVVDFVACACIAISDNGDICNINADTIATKIAIGTKAHKLIFLSDVDGVKIDGETAGLITVNEIAGHIASGAVTSGMKVKLESCKNSLESGIRRVHLINGLREDALKKEIFEPTGPGTMLINEEDRGAYENEVAAQKLLGG